MKRVAFISVFLFLMAAFSFLSCNKNKTNSTNTSGNEIAVANSTMTIGGSCWLYDSCNVNPNKMKGICGSCTVELIFGNMTFTGTYALTSGVPAAGQAQIKITNPPSQSIGIWYSKMGLLSVISGTSGIVATFTNIPCNQMATSNPTVTASGTMVCY